MINPRAISYRKLQLYCERRISMDVQHMRYFLSVAQLLNFTRAAAEHHIAQPSMSQIVASMEKELGAALFLRNNKSVQLTPAGRIFYDEAKFLVARYDDAVKKTLLASAGLDGSLHIGYWGPYEPILIPRFLGKFRKKYPNIDISITQESNQLLLAHLENGLVDVVFSSPYPFQNRPDICCRLLDSSPSCAVVHKNHPLADFQKLTPTDLNNEKIVLLDMQDPQDNSKLEQDWLKNGLTPKLVAKPTLYENMLLLVESEIGITLLPRCLERFMSPNLRFIELESDMTVDFGVAWSKSSSNPVIHLLIDIIEEETKTMPRLS